MNPWLWADIAFVTAIIPCAVVILRARRITDCLVAAQMAAMLGTLALMCLAEGTHRPSFYVLSLALALISFPATLLFAHFIEMWWR